MPRVWTSYIDGEDFQFNINAEYAAPWEDILAERNENIATGSTLLNQGAALLGSDAHVPVQTISNQLMSTLQWTSSERPSFDITMYFINFDDENDNPEREAVELESLTLPRGAENDEGSLTLRPPGGYSNGGVSGNQRVTGTWTLQMGRWFRAPYLVLENAVMTQSQLRTPMNKPLYAEVNVQLRPYQIITEREFRDYFIAPGVSI